MRTSRSTTCAALCLALLHGPLAVAATAPPAAAKSAAKKPAAAAAKPPGVKAGQLVAGARQAVAGIYKAAKASQGKLDPKNKKQAPFWQAVKQMNGTLVEVDKQAKAKDKRLAATLSKGSETLAKLKTVWPRIGVTDSKVAGYLEKLDNAYTALRSARGAEGARARKAGPLTAAEKDKLGKIKSSQTELSKKLSGLQAKAKAHKDPGTEATLARLIEQSNRIAAAQLTVDAFLLAIVLLDQFQGEWDGYSYYVGPDYRAGWTEIDVWVETSFTSYDSWYVESFESYSVESFSTWETSFEVSDSFDYEVTDVSLAEVDTLETEFEASFSYDEMSWEAYSEENVTAEMEDTVYEEADDNLDVAAESWEEEGLEIEAGEDMLDADDQAEFADEDEGDEDDAEAGDADEDEDADAEADDGDEEADDGSEDAEDGEEDADDGSEDADDGSDDADDGGDEGDDGGEDADDGGDEGSDESDDEPPAAAFAFLGA